MRRRRLSILSGFHRGFWAAVSVVAGIAADLRAEEFVNPKVSVPPPAAPIRRDAAEGVPPLPLPATPLRRSEKKREPAQPSLIGSVTFAPTTGGGQWQTTTIDIEQWVAFTNSSLGQRYRFVSTDFSSFSYDPAELPILYFTGWKPLPSFDAATVDKIRRYLLEGGTWVVHSNCGRPEFNDSFRKEIAKIFPDRRLAPIGADHPLYAAFQAVPFMRVYKGREAVRTLLPSAGLLETVNIGTRAAVIFSPIDMSCGWDASQRPIEGGTLYDTQDSLRLAANIVTYILAEYQYGRFFSQVKTYRQPEAVARDQLVLGQIVHNGDWDATPHGLPNLLRHIDQQTTLKVQFKRVPVDPEKTDLFSFPVLYLSGQRDMTLSDESRKRLRAYLERGGSLVADCVVGSGEFDGAIRQELASICPQAAMKPLAASHPLYTFVEDTRRVQLSPLAKQLYKTEAASPALEAIEIDGRLAVVYSKLSLSAGWEQLPRAYNVGYADSDALKLGTNVLTFLASH